MFQVRQSVNEARTISLATERYQSSSSAHPSSRLCCLRSPVRLPVPASDARESIARSQRACCRRRCLRERRWSAGRPTVMHVQRVWSSVSVVVDVGGARSYAHRRASVRLPRRRLHAVFRSAQHASLPRADALGRRSARLHRLWTTLQARAAAHHPLARSLRRPPVRLSRLSAGVQHPSPAEGARAVSQRRASVHVQPVLDDV